MRVRLTFKLGEIGHQLVKSLYVFTSLKFLYLFTNIGVTFSMTP